MVHSLPEKQTNIIINKQNGSALTEEWIRALTEYKQLEGDASQGHRIY
jgi:hypothetical protein